MADHTATQRTVRIRIQTTLRFSADGAPGINQEHAGLVHEQVNRALERVTNPDREDAGILSYTNHIRTSSSVDIDALVRFPDAEAPDDYVLGIVKRALDPVTNYRRSDPGLLSFALEIVSQPAP